MCTLEIRKTEVSKSKKHCPSISKFWDSEFGGVYFMFSIYVKETWGAFGPSERVTALGNVRFWITTLSSVVMISQIWPTNLTPRLHFYVCQIFCTEQHMLQSHHAPNASAPSSHGKPDQEGWLGELCYHWYSSNREPWARAHGTSSIQPSQISVLIWFRLT